MDLSLAVEGVGDVLTVSFWMSFISVAYLQCLYGYGQNPIVGWLSWAVSAWVFVGLFGFV